ncbi:MAG TPA: hypothetical protein VF677_09995 [Flavobacterium sp.]|jgi:hypothetical protein
MTARNLAKVITIIFILSIAGISMWLYEIRKILGWYNLNWVDRGKLYSPYIAALIVIFAFMAPFIISKQAAIKKLILPAIILYAVNILCFIIGRQLCYEWYNAYSPFATIDILVDIMTDLLIYAFILFAFLGSAYWLVANKFIKKNNPKNMVFIILLLIVIFPLSQITIAISPGFGDQTGWVDTVKMGYPVFWTTMMFGISGIITASQKRFIQVEMK